MTLPVRPYAMYCGGVWWLRSLKEERIFEKSFSKNNLFLSNLYVIYFSVLVLFRFSFVLFHRSSCFTVRLVSPFDVEKNFGRYRAQNFFNSFFWFGRPWFGRKRSTLDARRLCGAARCVYGGVIFSISGLSARRGDRAGRGWVPAIFSWFRVSQTSG